MIFLKNDPAKIYERKRDLSRDEIERQLIACQNIVDSCSYSHVINNISDLDNLVSNLSAFFKTDIANLL